MALANNLGFARTNGTGGVKLSYLGLPVGIFDLQAVIASSSQLVPFRLVEPLVLVRVVSLIAGGEPNECLEKPSRIVVVVVVVVVVVICG